MDLSSLAKEGSKKIFCALKKFFIDSKIVNEIYDEIDKNLFLAATQDERYRYIEDVKENDIFDCFIDSCIVNDSLDVDVNKFVDENYKNKSNEAKAYIKWFYGQITDIIHNVLKSHLSLENKIIIKNQERSLKKILEQLEKITNFQQQEKNSHTKIVTYSANMQDKQWCLNNFNECVLDLSMKKFPMQPNSSCYWEYFQESLVSEFNKKVLSYLEDGYSIDLYALAPIPLLVFLGNLFANRPNINIYQLKKVPSTFAWDENGERLDINVTQLPEKALTDEVALLMSFSGKVDKQNVINIVGDKIPMIEMSIKYPYDDFLRTKSQLDEFLTKYRQVKSYLTSKGVKRIHLFAAIPISFAIGIGQAYNPNYDYSIVTYDFRQGLYTKAIIIGENDGFKQIAE
jgi:hypothetical protein